jgi:hypothetical protein
MALSDVAVAASVKEEDRLMVQLRFDSESLESSMTQMWAFSSTGVGKWTDAAQADR